MNAKKMAKRCGKAGHPLTHVFGSSGPLTRTCECGKRHGETICAQCGGPWSTADGHPQDCFMWQAMHSGRPGTPLGDLEALADGGHDPRFGER